MKKFEVALLSCLMLTTVSCAQLGVESQVQAATDGNSSVCSSLNAEQELLVSLSQEMVDEGRLHAALANLEQLPSGMAVVELRKAKILRILNPPVAKSMYRTLINTGCYVAEAHHGLGQIAIAEHYYREAVGHLRIAAQSNPTDKSVRNDLGLVYLYLRRLPEARFELMTALELDAQDETVAGNLLTLLLYQDQWQQASEFIGTVGLTPAHFEAAQIEANRLQQEDGTSTSFNDDI